MPYDYTVSISGTKDWMRGKWLAREFFLRIPPWFEYCLCEIRLAASADQGAEIKDLRYGWIISRNKLDHPKISPNINFENNHSFLMQIPLQKKFIELNFNNPQNTFRLLNLAAVGHPEVSGARRAEPSQFPMYTNTAWLVGCCGCAFLIPSNKALSSGNTYLRVRHIRQGQIGPYLPHHKISEVIQATCSPCPRHGLLGKVLVSDTEIWGTKFSIDNFCSKSNFCIHPENWYTVWWRTNFFQ